MIDQIRKVRRECGWSQRTLAARICVDAQAIKRLEGGAGSVATLIAAMTALHIRLTGLGPTASNWPRRSAYAATVAPSRRQAARFS
ncbi:helix-turn-helix domain-containing protein [Sphingomonas sp. HMP6]|uniref:helix-turn-helix domain-containing protein n=1 Tax=Sphingomonas sp. HMP6 TaxID=1517551 RepID=UPI001596C69E